MRSANNVSIYLSTRQITDAPHWRRAQNSIEYERDLQGDVHFLARQLEDDGVRFHYGSLISERTSA